MKINSTCRTTTTAFTKKKQFTSLKEVEVAGFMVSFSQIDERNEVHLSQQTKQVVNSFFHGMVLPRTGRSVDEIDLPIPGQNELENSNKEKRIDDLMDCYRVEAQHTHTHTTNVFLKTMNL